MTTEANPVAKIFPAAPRGMAHAEDLLRQLDREIHALGADNSRLRRELQREYAARVRETPPPYVTRAVPIMDYDR